MRQVTIMKTPHDSWKVPVPKSEHDLQSNIVEVIEQILMLRLGNWFQKIVRSYFCVWSLFSYYFGHHLFLLFSLFLITLTIATGFEYFLRIIAQVLSLPARQIMWDTKKQRLKAGWVIIHNDQRGDKQVVSNQF